MSHIQNPSSDSLVSPLSSSSELSSSISLEGLQSIQRQFEDAVRQALFRYSIQVRKEQQRRYKQEEKWNLMLQKQEITAEDIDRTRDDWKKMDAAFEAEREAIILQVRQNFQLKVIFADRNAAGVSTLDEYFRRHHLTIRKMVCSN